MDEFIKQMILKIWFASIAKKIETDIKKMFATDGIDADVKLEIDVKNIDFAKLEARKEEISKAGSDVKINDFTTLIFNEKDLKG